jgi:hypothetical protein
MKHRFSPSLALTFTVLVSAFTFQVNQTDSPKPFTGKIVGIVDGDTIIDLFDRTPAPSPARWH